MRPSSELAFFFTQVGRCSSAKSIQLLLHSSAPSETWPANFFTRQREKIGAATWEHSTYLGYWLEEGQSGSTPIYTQQKRDATILVVQEVRQSGICMGKTKAVEEDYQSYHGDICALTQLSQTEEQSGWLWKYIMLWREKEFLSSVTAVCLHWNNLTESQVKISVSFLLLIQQKPGGSETPITVIKKNTWQQNMDTCQCAIVSNLEISAKDQRSNKIVTWSEWRMAAHG